MFVFEQGLTVQLRSSLSNRNRKKLRKEQK